MRYFFLVLFPYVAIFLQSTLFGFYSIKGTIPDLMLIFVVFFALLNKLNKGTAYGFFCGLLEDVYLGRFLGLNALAKGITAYIIGKIQGNLFKDNLVVGISAVFIGTLLNSFLLFLLSFFTIDASYIGVNILPSILYQTVYNIIIAAPLYVWYYNSSKNGVLKSSGEI